MLPGLCRRGLRIANLVDIVIDICVRMICTYVYLRIVYACMYLYVYLKIVNYHSRKWCSFIQNKLKKCKSDIKESGIRLFFGPRGLSYAPFATSGGMKTTEKS